VKRNISTISVAVSVME